MPVVFGPDIDQVEDEGRALVAAGGGFQAGDAAAVFERCRTLLADPRARAAAGRSALAVAATFSGAVDTVAAAAQDILDGPGRTP